MSDSANKSKSNELSLHGQKRLLKDIKSLYSDTNLEKNGIHYVHSSTDMTKGYALIIGPEDTPYQHGAYLFEIVFPENYPHNPPKFNYLTNDGTTRFHPNLYINGKVCLSILNTWNGEKWSSSITLSHVLLTLVSILTKNALLHEPCVRLKNHAEQIRNYDIFITYKNLYFSVLQLVKSNSTFFKPEMSVLHTKYREHVKNNIHKIKECIDKLESDNIAKQAENLRIFYGLRNTSSINFNSIKANYDNLFKDKFFKVS